MGITFSCPFALYTDAENALESVRVKAIDVGDGEVKTPLPSSTLLRSLGSVNMTVEKSISFKCGKSEKMIQNEDSSSDKVEDGTPISVSENNCECQDLDNVERMIQEKTLFDPNNPKHHAAIKLQKVYKSFRTRRKLADCAVLIEQSWWKLLDFAELKHSSISFFDLDKHESAISRWSRARTRVAKLGKGLSKNDNAQKLARQHWLEAIDPRHRYGHNLHFYYVKWLNSKSKQPFFYWLDIGEGKEVNLEKCPRSKLQQQFIKYLGPMERKAYEVVIEDGKFVYQQTGELLNTTEDAKWIFVLSTSKNLYVGKKKKGSFQHSSFLAGGATLAAGQLIVENGFLKAVWPHSGHYRPTEENFKDFLSFLRENDVDLTDVNTSPMDDEDSSLGDQSSSKHLRTNSSEEDLLQALNNLENEEEINLDGSVHETGGLVEEEEVTCSALEQEHQKLHGLGSRITNLEIPDRYELMESLGKENTTVEPSSNGGSIDSIGADGYHSAEEIVPEDVVLERINSKKGTESYQLGRQLSCKWTTGAGPRIGCVRDFPSEMQFRALEKVNLSPRRVGFSRSKSVLSRRTPDPATASEGQQHFDIRRDAYDSIKC